MRIEPEFGGLSIILVGNFNPAIFSPQWFARCGIVSEAEAEAAELGVIHPEIAAFIVGGKNIQIETTRFSVETTEAPWVSSCDLITRTFGDYLSYTPITRFGINRHVHFRVDSEETRNKIGRRLAPITPWGEWGATIATLPKERRGGCVDISMQEPWIDNEWRGHVQATIQPSAKLPGNTGIYMGVNDHHELIAVNPGEGSERAMRRLADCFDGSIRKAEWIVDQIMKLPGETA
ncbi:hypothetical protein J2X36_003215 [Methylobacterium sp. BE186]|uniref:hypothetical protein n=1 Tax=Methylobacterium sp. BE186 TaxID=2817715 RepID=UPI002860EA30|nr:hypothetical protein [Methylobacterium sp. BE186]MDR7038451.1 hypothetical protein [Methylobacterium sp. BE186]